jgi:3-dehydroquinate synthase
VNSFENFKSQIIIRNQLPFHKLDPEEHFLIYDPKVLEINSEEIAIKEFIESFPNRLALKGGEDVKDFKNFPKQMEQILKKWPQPIKRSQSLVILGGGSLGDFGGFVASILKRGLSLIHIPTTWLAALDSSHGGKNALNIMGVKNQLGTFHPAKKIFIIKDILEFSSPELKEQCYGELIKMSLIGESQFFKEIMLERRPAQDFMWRFLKFAIEDKYQVILQDPYETKQIRQVLNFGHTFGHALESHFSWSHGDSVLQGLFFALEWSRYRADLSQNLYEQIVNIISEKFNRGPAHNLSWYRKPSSQVIEKILLADKKINENGEILFIFLKSIGKPLIKPVLVEDLLSEAKRQNWVK